MLSFLMLLYIGLLNWDTQLLVCSGYIPWLDRLKSVFSYKEGYKLNSLLRHNRRSRSKTDESLCLLS